MKKRLLLIIACFTTATASVSAQCVMCSKTAAELDNSGAAGLNAGIIYLAALPLLLMGTVGFVWWKRNRNVEGQQ